MSLEQEKIGKLIERVDELIIILKRVAEDLMQVSGSLKSFAVKPVAEPVTSEPLGIEEFGGGASEEDVKTMFSEDLENLLSFEEKTNYIQVKPRQFLGSDNFAKIASIVREMGGDYVSAGKESHFRVPRKVD